MSAPARLLAVRLQGFKSFADRTHVEFGPGISAVVGPNGSGKSNLADALRWALGEQGRALRTRKSEDVVWAGSEKRPAVGMADVQITLDNADGLLPVEYGVVELGRRLYRSGENDYLLNRQRVRLKDLVDLLDAGHLAENAFLFIGQGMVDQALALRPEERRPLFEEVAGVRRHERRRRRAEEQLAESAANLARVDDILAELRPQARRLAQQAEQQANRRTAVDELATALVASGHARWHAAAARTTSADDALSSARARVDAAMADLLEQERAMSAASATLAGQATAEAAARATLEQARASRSAIALREGRNASELEAAGRERKSVEASRIAAAADVQAARAELAQPIQSAPDDLAAELATLEAEIAAGSAAPTVESGLSPAEAAAIRRLEAARAQEQATARRRAAEAERHATEEAARSDVATRRVADANTARDEAATQLIATAEAEAAARQTREALQDALATSEAAARAAADAVAVARSAATAAVGRRDDARRALEAAEGAGFSKAARARGGRSIGDGLIVESTLQPAVDAALSGLGRAHVLARSSIGEVLSERGVAIVAESLQGRGDGDAAARGRIVEAARLRGGGLLADAVRRDDSGAVAAVLARVVWVPDTNACLEVQAQLPPGWLVVDRAGTLLAGDLATWTRPDGRGLHLRADLARAESDAVAAEATVASAAARWDAATSGVADARTSLVDAREREALAAAAHRRAEEADRSAAARADAAAREAAWLSAQVVRLRSEADRLRAAIPPDPGPAPDAAEAVATPDAVGPDAAVRARLEALGRRRDAVARDLDQARRGRLEAERRRAAAEAAIALGERQLAFADRMAADLADREARLAIEREDVRSAAASAEQAVAASDAALAMIVSASAGERERLQAAEAGVSSLREGLRIAQERARVAERDELEARLALDALREQLAVELAGLGESAIRHLRSSAQSGGSAPAPSSDEATSSEAASDDLAAAIDSAAAIWSATPPVGEGPSPARLATLRRRFHDVGAVNPFAVEEHAALKTRLDGLESQRADIAAATDRTRELITELDTLVSEQFRRTFQALEQAFDERFRQLFGGGFAKLALTEPDDLASTGIDITARPPGKKAQALAMLSGGERALTAVALLFAMLEIRPVPFCVLDEVDAALDEANIGRFTDALRDLSKATQCIVITHNRGTIEAADAMYGVTVGDDSVSRVISLRLEEATALAARAAAARGGEAVGLPVGAD